MSDSDSANTKTTSGSSTTLPQPPTMGHTLSCSSSSIPVSSIENSGSRGFIPLRRRSSVSRPRDVIVVVKKLPVRIHLESDGGSFFLLPPLFFRASRPTTTPCAAQSCR